MKQVVTCQEMKSCDSYTIERMGVPSCVLMERAALKVVEELEKRFAGEIKSKRSCASAEVEIMAGMVWLLRVSCISTTVRAQFIWQEIRITGRRNAATVPDCCKLIRCLL